MLRSALRNLFEDADVHYECRSCGTRVADAEATCESCGSEEIAIFEVT